MPSGGPWWKAPVKAGTVSDPFLMTGFDKKVLHLTQTGADKAWFAIEVDFLGDGTWNEYQKLYVDDGGYLAHPFPDAFSAHWVRLKVDSDCTATAYFHYH